MKFFNRIKSMAADNSGMSLIELVIAAALITIVGAGFCTAAMSASATTVKNNEEGASRNIVVAAIDDRALVPIVTSEESTKFAARNNGQPLPVYSGHTKDDIQGFIDADAMYTKWAEVHLVDSSNNIIAGTKVDCGICKPIDSKYSTNTKKDGTTEPIDRMFFGFETPNGTKDEIIKP